MLRLQELDEEISHLETEYNDKSAALEKCAKDNQNFKTVGVITLGGTGVGVLGNVALAKHYKDAKNSGGGGHAGNVIAGAELPQAEHLSRAEKDQRMCAEFLASGDSLDWIRTIEGCEDFQG